MFSTLTNSPKRKLSAACYACGHPHGTCVHTRMASDIEKQWTFQQENQQTILHPQTFQSQAMQQTSAVTVQHRKLSNGSLVPEPEKLVAATASPLPNNLNTNNYAGADDADKTYQIYHWKCDMGNSRSGKHRSNTIPVTTQQQQQQAAAAAASLKVELPVQTQQQVPQQLQQQQASPIVSPSTPVSTAMPINLAAPTTPLSSTSMVMLSKSDYDKLVQRLDVLEQANFTLLQQVHALNNQQAQILMLLQNCLGQQHQQQQTVMHLGTQLMQAPQQDAATDMELQLDLDDDIRNFVAKATQQQQQAQHQQQHPVRPAVQIRQSNQSAQFTVLNAPQQQQQQPSIVLNGPSQSPKVLYQF